MYRFKSIFLFLAIAIIALWLANDSVYMIRLIFQDPPPALVMPVAGIHPNQLANTWGAPRSEGRTHQGIDIFAPKGTPVVTTTHGIVQEVGKNRLGGNVVWILGPGGQRHYYAHLDGFSAIKTHDRVGAGVVIGFVGNTGNARGTHPHLHYGIYSFTGRALNPFPLLSLTVLAGTPLSASALILFCLCRRDSPSN